MTGVRSRLEELAAFCGVQASYEDALGVEQRANDEALVRVLRSLDAPIARPAGAEAALREMRQSRWDGVLEPTTVAIDGGPGAVQLRLPAEQRGAFRLAVALEGGGERVVEGRCEQLEPQARVQVEGRWYVRAEQLLPEGLPWGYHRLIFEAEGARHEGWLLRAPRRVFEPEGLRTWGVFAPTYALHRAESWGAGNLGDLEHLAALVSAHGGGLVGTLPLLATFLDEPFDPSPYVPVSRLAWNELFLDLRAVPEWERSAEARALVGSESWQREIADLRVAELVDYARQWARVRPVLDALARCAFETPASREALDRFAGEHPHAADYARFRAIMASQGRPWGEWPEPLRSGDVGAEEGAPEVYRRHLYAQWRLSQQLESLAATAERHGPGLYLDLPLGVHPAGYDAWHEQESFASGVSVGAPPDDFFTRGQNWGFAPLHPRHLRRRGYRYFADCMRSQMAHAGMLRIDHVMWLHRLFWIPQGMEPPHGVYVQNRADDMYAVLALESQRQRCAVVGEDLGTVPQEVPKAMSEHGVLRMYVVQFQAGPDGLEDPPSSCVASLNTHDMHPFAAWWCGNDVDDRVRLGFLEPEDAESARLQRAKTRDLVRRHLGAGRRGAAPEDDAQSIMRALLERLAVGPARVVLVGLEDLWGEKRPQNVPGTGDEQHPNWRGKARLPLEALRTDEGVITAFQRIDERRRS
ncbi:MAG: 4-alpha-glucanotransferase [Myxococcota bacterium]